MIVPTALWAGERVFEKFHNVRFGFHRLGTVFTTQLERRFLLENRCPDHVIDGGYMLHLLSEGADINAGSPNGTTALMMAAHEARLSTLDLLISRGADVSRRNQEGASALDWAKKAKEPRLAEHLRRAGARD